MDADDMDPITVWAVVEYEDGTQSTGIVYTDDQRAASKAVADTILSMLSTTLLVQSDADRISGMAQDRARQPSERS